MLGNAKQFTGFIGAEVIRPEEGSLSEYITLVKFDSCKNLKLWRESSELISWQEKLKKMLIVDSHKQERSGMEIWFDRPSTPQRLKEPPYWKQVVIGIICVYPLVMLLIWALEPVMQDVPREISTFVNVIILSALLTYPVMPWVTRLLRVALPKVNKQ